MQNIKILALLGLLSFSIVLIAEDDHHDHDDEHHEIEQHAAHEHGSAKADISRELDQLRIRFNIPAIDIYGFEHEARNDEERQIITDADSKFDNVSKIIITEPECQVISHDSHTKHHDEHGHEEHDNDVHSDVEKEYLFKCIPDSSIVLNFALFREFPTLQKIDVQFVSSQSVKVFTMTPNKPAITVN